MTAPLSADTARLPVSPILEMARRAAEMAAAGLDIVDLTLGEPDFAPPAHVGNAAIGRVGGALGYTPANGLPSLRTAVRHRLLQDRGLDFADDQVAIGCGAKQIIFNTFLATIKPSDEVILPAPYWASYPDMVGLAGGNTVIVPCPAEDGFRLTPAALDDAITPKTRWLVLNAPGNPSGATYNAGQLGELAEVLRRHPHVMVMSDEIYAHIRYDDRPYVSIAADAFDLSDRVLVVDGVSKAYGMTGWRVGWGLGPAGLIARINAVQGQNCTQTATLSQIAAIAALEGPQEVLSERNAIYRGRRDAALEILSESPSLDVVSPNGAFYLFPRLRGTADDRTVALRLLDAGVATVPGSGFGMSGHLRLSFATGQARLEKGCRRIVAALEASR